jgi:hypothetical protein
MTTGHQPPAETIADASATIPIGTDPGSHAAARTVAGGIETDIRTRVGLVTVTFAGRDQARAVSATGGYSYRGRQYSGTALLSGPMWSAMTSLGWALWPGGQAAGRSTADTIATIIAADVGAPLREHPEILDLAEQARQEADKARARRDLACPDREIAAAGQHLIELLCKRSQLRSIADGADPGPRGSIWDYISVGPQAALEFVAQTARLRMDGGYWVMENDDACGTVHSLISDARSLLGWQAGLPPLETPEYRTASDGAEPGPLGPAEADHDDR